MINSNEKLYKSVFNTISKSEAYSHEEPVPIKHWNHYDTPAECIVSNKRTYQAAMDSAQSRLKTAVLNFANAFTPGGGVLSGSGAQEESLCRCSTLYPCLNFDNAFAKYYGYNNSYNMGVLGSNGLIYSPDVTIIKTDESEPKRIPEKKWIKVDVITCAAPHLFGGELVKGYIDTMEIRIRRILTVAVNNKVDNLILGAFGCGAFYNPPDIVARLFKEALREFSYTFKRVEFTIMEFDDKPNYVTFKKVLA